MVIWNFICVLCTRISLCEVEYGCWWFEAYNRCCVGGNCTSKYSCKKRSRAFDSSPVDGCRYKCYAIPRGMIIICFLLYTKYFYLFRLFNQNNNNKIYQKRENPPTLFTYPWLLFSSSIFIFAIVVFFDFVHLTQFNFYSFFRYTVYYYAFVSLICSSSFRFLLFSRFICEKLILS